MIHVRKRSLFKQCRTCMQNLALLDLEPFTFYKLINANGFLFVVFKFSIALGEIFQSAQKLGKP